MSEGHDGGDDARTEQLLNEVLTLLASDDVSSADAARVEHLLAELQARAGSDSDGTHLGLLIEMLQGFRDLHRSRAHENAGEEDQDQEDHDENGDGNGNGNGERMRRRRRSGSQEEEDEDEDDREWPARLRRLRAAMDGGAAGRATALLEEASSALALATERTLARGGFSAHALAAAAAQALRVLGDEGALYACRSLAALADIVPGPAVAALRRGGVLPALRARLAAAGAVEVLEEALHVLALVAAEDPAAVLAGGGVAPALAYLDFLAVPTQRTVVRTAAAALAAAGDAGADALADALGDDPRAVVGALAAAHRTTADAALAGSALDALAALAALVLTQPSSPALAAVRSALFGSSDDDDKDDDGVVATLVATLRACCSDSSSEESSEATAAACTRLPFSSDAPVTVCRILCAACVAGGASMRARLARLGIADVLHAAFVCAGVIPRSGTGENADEDEDNEDEDDWDDDWGDAADSDAAGDAAPATAEGERSAGGAAHVDALLGLVDALAPLPAALGVPAPAVPPRDLDRAQGGRLGAVLAARARSPDPVVVALRRPRGAVHCATVFGSESAAEDAAERARAHALVRATGPALARLGSGSGGRAAPVQRRALGVLLRLLHACGADGLAQLPGAPPTALLAQHIAAGGDRAAQALALALALLLLVRTRGAAHDTLLRACARDGVFAEVSRVATAAASETDGDEQEKEKEGPKEELSAETVAVLARLVDGLAPRGRAPEGEGEGDRLARAVAAVAAVADSPAVGAEGTAAAAAALTQLRDALTADHHCASAHEVIHSGVIPALLRFFVAVPDAALATAATAAKDTATETGADAALLARCAVLEPRMRAFVDVFLDGALVRAGEGTGTTATTTATVAHAGPGCRALLVLVRRVRAIAAQAPAFRAHGGAGSTPAQRARAVELLRRGFRIVLRRADGETALDDLGPESVGIDAFADVLAIEGYVVRRVGARCDLAPPRSIDAENAALMQQPPTALDGCGDDCTDAERRDATFLRERRIALGHRVMFVTDDGVLLPYDYTMVDIVRLDRGAGALLDAISSGESSSSKDSKDTNSKHPLEPLWAREYTVRYQRVTPAAWTAAYRRSEAVLAQRAAQEAAAAKLTLVPVACAPLVHYLATYAPPALGEVAGLDATATGALALLEVLHRANAHARALLWPGRAPPASPVLPARVFVAPAPSRALAAQLADAAVACFPRAVARWARVLAGSALRCVLAPAVRRRLLVAACCRTGHALRALHAPTALTERLARRRARVRVARDRVLQAAVRAHTRLPPSTVLDVRYAGEPGIGLGPTLEFYSTVSRELQQARFGLFVDEAADDNDDDDDDDDDDGAMVDCDRGSSSSSSSSSSKRTRYVVAPGGLFPALCRDPEAEDAPIAVTTSSDAAFTAVHKRADEQHQQEQQEQQHHQEEENEEGVLDESGDTEKEGALRMTRSELFFFFGTLVAAALADGRVLDAGFAPALLKPLLGEPLAYEDMACTHPTLARSLAPLVASVRADAANAAAGSQTQTQTTGTPGLRVEDLCLTMAVPGRGGRALEPGGAATLVTAATLPRFLARLCAALLAAGVADAHAAFAAGVRHGLGCAPGAPLAVLSAAELARVLSGADGAAADAHWARGALLAALAPAQGYTRESAAVQALATVLAALTRAQRRLFLLFVTGAPRLPVGGFGALVPRLTVARKPPPALPAGARADAAAVRAATDAMLPSANCCFALLKLPSYSSADVLRERLLYAIENCQGSFDLS